MNILNLRKIWPIVLSLIVAITVLNIGYNYSQSKKADGIIAQTVEGNEGTDLTPSDSQKPQKPQNQSFKSSDQFQKIIVYKTDPKTESVKKINSDVTQSKNTLQKQVEMIIGSGSGAGDYIVEIKNGETAFSILRRAAQAQKIVLKYDQYSFGVFVKQIGDLQGGGDKYWMFYVNGQLANVGCSEYILKPNDRVEWRFEKVSW